jgi:hypothetical protein
MNELIPYRRDVFTFMERLILQEAAKRQDYQMWMRITMQAIARELGIPARLMQAE